MRTCMNLFVLVCLCVSTLFLSGMDGCSPTDDPDPAAFVSASPPTGSTVQKDATIVAVFDAPPSGVDVNVPAGATFSVAGPVVTITGPFQPGSLTLVLTWSDGATALTYTIEPDTTEGGETPVVTPKPVPEPHHFGDQFNVQKLSNPNWRWRNEPADWDVGQTIHSYLIVEAEKNRNLWASDNTHFLYQETRDDAFDVYTDLFAFWKTDSGVVGLVVKSPADNDWVTLKCWVRGESSRVQFQGRGRGLGFPDTPWARHQIVPNAIRDGGREVRRHFRIRKEGNAYTGYYRTFAGKPWIKIGTANVALTPPLQVGIYAGNAADKGWLMAGYNEFESVK